MCSAQQKLDRAPCARPPQVVAGQTAAIALKKVKRSAVRKGMVLADASLRPEATWRAPAAPLPPPPQSVFFRFAPFHKPSRAPPDSLALSCTPRREFDAEIAILTHSTTIQPRYQAVIHCEIIRQAATVVRARGRAQPLPPAPPGAGRR